MSKEGIRALIEDCSRRVPERHAPYLEYFQKLSALSGEADADNNRIAARLWLALLRPTSIPPLAKLQWTFKVDEVLLGILHRMFMRGLIGAGDTIDITQSNEEGQVTIIGTFDIVPETMKTLSSDFNANSATSGAELKLIQLLLTASTNPNRAISGDLLSIALNKLTEVFLHSKQSVNQNAARAAITQLVNERMDVPPGGSTSSIDQGITGSVCLIVLEVIFKWLCSVIRNPRCPASLTVMCLDLILSVLKSHETLFKTGEVAVFIGTDLLPTLIGPLNLADEAVYEKCLSILEIVIRDHFARNREAIEIILSDYIGSPSGVNDEGGAITKGPIIKSHLRPFRNKLQTVKFINTQIFGNPATLFSCFVNYDSEIHTLSVIDSCLELINILTEVDWHRAEGSRIPGTAFTDKDLAVKLSCVDALITFMKSTTTWHQSSPGKARAESLSNYNQNTAKKRALKNCVQLFNSKPRLGLDLAIKSGFADEHNLESQAKWLRFTRGISKRSIGEFLGLSTSAELLQKYTDTFDFHELSFVSALRLFLESFRIPGESQVIERFLENFSRKLHETAPDVFPDAEMLFQISYSTLMLNTDMYSMNVREKMSRESFIKNTMGAIDKDKDLSEDVLNGIFGEISIAEIQLYSQTVEHPLPLGSRPISEFIQCKDGDFVGALLTAVVDLWARTASMCIDKFDLWPSRLEFGAHNSQFTTHFEFICSLLECFSDVVQMTCRLGMEKERYCALERLLATSAFRPDYDSDLKGEGTLSWLYDIFDEHGSELGSSWVVTLSCLSTWDLASIVDANHNIRELNLSSLDGRGLLSFLVALFNSKNLGRNFISHYANRVYQLPSSQLERVLKYSYDKENHVAEPLFAVLAKGVDDSLLSTTGFGILQRVAREHMPLILSLSDDVMFGFLRALERFGLQSDATMSRDAIETFVLIGDLLFSQHRSEQTVFVVNDEEFFLKWYHVLSGLSRIAAEQHFKESAKMSMQNLFKLLKEQGTCYQEGAWRVIWRSIIFPLLEELSAPGADEEMFIRLMEWAVELVSVHNTKLITAGIPDIFEMEGMALRLDLGGVTDLGLQLIKELIIPNHEKCFTARHWSLMIETLQRVYESYSPGDLFEITALAEEENPTDNAEQAIQFDVSMSATSVTFPERYRPVRRELTNLQILAKQCTAQLMLLDLFKEITTKAEDSILSPASSISFDSVNSFLGLILRLYEFALAFNGNLPLRQMMVNAGIGANLEELVLTRQETGSLSLLVGILFEFYDRGLKKGEQLTCLYESSDALRELAQRYFKISTVALQRCVEMRLPNAARKRISKSWNEVASTVLRQWSSISQSLDLRNKGSNTELYNIGERMVETQLSVALEFCLLMDRNHHAFEEAKEFVMTTNQMLLRFRLESFGISK
ncbi:Sec7p [Paramicrosporidium saccamoebae]|uniref:Sec7p n=1 Tax=Paramicrosporidium saccamoebae TaxID=1246581 RepID=A0A2H9TQF3_9FUNG|nr:Sec7p [Paramicrosporidium saccamoebae]PJF19962.1 Sec7p [Paramicrosporidium saccamoebae]